MGHNSSTHSGLIFSRRRRSDKDVADNSALTQVFLSTVRGYPQEDLLKITDYYKPDLVYVIEYDITSILQNLVTKQILTNDEAKRSKDKEESEGTEGVESFVNEVITKGGVLLLGLWEAMAEEMVRYPSPNLTRILKEVTEGGANLLKEIEVSLQSPPIRIDLKVVLIVTFRLTEDPQRSYIWVNKQSGIPNPPWSAPCQCCGP
ncbi:uncharacterized protein LOC120534607 [Polypterus senegalus]|uniref:uncharacterized protein LOC120534607 n=1 Tax=Polypterus senegalus TaxID=55291 RepID=UPI00196469DD|nr:uncharacterized protein LOC120534607 [Polypterus senegalus]